jgi:hypothetical protein
MSAEDWETKYFEILAKFNFEKSETQRLKQNMARKQERYIDREHEYRRTIAQIEGEIEARSTKPLEVIPEHPPTHDEAILIAAAGGAGLEE